MKVLITRRPGYELSYESHKKANSARSERDLALGSASRTRDRREITPYLVALSGLNVDTTVLVLK